jgi:hypothetical protein
MARRRQRGGSRWLRPSFARGNGEGEGMQTRETRDGRGVASEPAEWVTDMGNARGGQRTPGEVNEIERKIRVREPAWVTDISSL